jgi:hypothetical protein
MFHFLRASRNGHGFCRGRHLSLLCALDRPSPKKNVEEVE